MALHTPRMRSLPRPQAKSTSHSHLTPNIPRLPIPRPTTSDSRRQNSLCPSIRIRSNNRLHPLSLYPCCPWVSQTDMRRRRRHPLIHPLHRCRRRRNRSLHPRHRSNDKLPTDTYRLRFCKCTFADRISQ